MQRNRRQGMMQETHRPGPLKQQNKKHKRGRHRTNREVAAAVKGKVDAKRLSRKPLNRDVSRVDRRHQQQQHRNLKRQQAIALKRGIGSESSPPILVAIYSRCGSFAQSSLLDLIKTCDADALLTETRGSLHVSIPKFKLRYQFLPVAGDDLHAVMDCVKVADILLLLHSIASDSEDVNSDVQLSAVFSHFLPTTVHVLNGLEGLPLKKRADAKTRVQRAIHDKFPDDKLHVVDRQQDALQLLHLIGKCKRKRMTYKSHRTQVVAEEVSFVGDKGSASLGKMVVSGFVRNRPLNVNSLLHVPGFSDFQMELIEVLSDPRPLSQRKRQEMSDTQPLRVIRPDLMLRESLERENELDPMEGEQTFPTAEEIADAAAKAAKKVVKRVPVGVSDYQAAWIIDEDNPLETQGGMDDGGDSSADEEEEEGELGLEEAASDSGGEEEEKLSSGEEEEMASVTVNEDEEARYDEKMDEEEEARTRDRLRQEREDEEFPDEVDTPLDTPARVRFARYRGLRSFHFSSWDPKENLPLDYSRIFQFQNFAHSKRRALKAADEEEEDDDFHAQVGSFVRITIANVKQEVWEYFSRKVSHPLVLHALLKHEQRMSLLNVLLRKHPSYDLPIRSKDRLIFHVGCRRFANQAVFSAHTNGSKFKYERFMRSDAAVVASMYAPITFPPASVVVFKEMSDGSHVLVATGSVLSVDPDRLVIKRIVLSGHPFKINKRLAVVRYMFFNNEDIAWFKPVELRTKGGRKGHIKSSLGTHGHMKCYFDRQLDSVDTVLMNLYKRVYPKWTYEEQVVDPVPS